MKYVVLIAVIMVVYMFWRNERRNELRERDEARRASPPAAAPALPQDMVRCEVCALHLPRNEALAGPDGRLYCSQEHRAGG